MTAIDELMTLLKEQGFEHYKHEVPAEEDCVAFYNGNRWHDCWESVDGEVNVTFSMTPQEAIAATMGDTDATPTRQDVAATVGASERTTTRHGKYKTKYGRKVPLCECCGYSIGDMRWHYCPSCGAKVVDERAVVRRTNENPDVPHRAGG